MANQIEVEVVNRTIEVDLGVGVADSGAATDQTARDSITAETAARKAADTALGTRIDNINAGEASIETDDATLEGDGSSGDKLKIKDDGVGESQIADALLAKINRASKVFVEGNAPTHADEATLAATGVEGDIWWVVDSTDEKKIEMWDNAGGTWVRFYKATGGPQGVQGAFYFRLYRAAATEPDKPTAGTYTLADDSFTVTPASWTIQAPTVKAGQRLWAIEAPIDPANDAGTTVDLTASDRWGAVFPVTGEKGEAGTGTGTADTSALEREIERQQHLTRGIKDVTHSAWEDAVDADGAVAFGIAANNMIDLNDTDFGGASGTIPAKTGQGRRLIYLFVRLPIAADRNQFQLVATPGATIRGNAWAELPVSGVNETGFDRDTYTYWWAETDLDEDPEQALQLQKLTTVLDPTEWEDKLGATAEKQISDLASELVDLLAARLQMSIEDIQHLLRDMHNNEKFGEWEDAADTDGDLHQAIIAGGAPTLTNAAFNGGGADLTIPDDQNQLTQLYIRVLKTVDVKTLRVVVTSGNYVRSFQGNQWFSENFQKPTSNTYDYYEVDGFQNGGGTTAQLQKRDAIATPTSYTGTLVDIPKSSLAEAVRDKLAEIDEIPGIVESINDARFQDLDADPDIDDVDVGDIVSVDGDVQKVAITDETAPNVFTGTIGSETIRTTGGREIRGIIGQYHPNGWTNDGSFTSNPDGISEFLIADNERRLQWAVKLAAFEMAKGSTFAEADKLAIKVILASTKVDEVVGAHYNTYSALVDGTDTRFLIFSHRKPEGDGNYNLFTEPSGTEATIEYFTVDGDGNAAATPFFTHIVSLKHLVPFIPNSEQQLDHRINQNAAVIESLKSNIQRDIDGIVGLAEGAAFVAALPDPDSYTDGSKVILTEDVEATVGDQTEVKYGQGVYGLADKPEDAATTTKKWMSFLVGSGPDYRGFAEGFAGVTADPLGDARPTYAYPPDTGNAVVSPLGDAIASFREHRGLVSSYDVAILTIKKAVYWELLEEIHGSAFGATTTPSITEENFVVRMIRTDTGATITNADEVYWFSRGALASLGETVTIAGVDYFQLYYSGDTRWFDGIPEGTECLLTLEHRHDSGHHTFDTAVSKAWSRLDRHDPVTNELARLNGAIAQRPPFVILARNAEYTAIDPKDPGTIYITTGNGRIYLGETRLT